MLKTFLTGYVGSVSFRKQDAIGDKSAFTVLNFSVGSKATLRSGETVTNWVSCKLWGPRAEGLQSHLVKGQGVAVEGRPEASAYAGEAGPRAELVLHVSEFEFLGPKPKNAPDKVVGEPAPDVTPPTE